MIAVREQEASGEERIKVADMQRDMMAEALKVANEALQEH